MSLLRPDGAVDARFDLFYRGRWNEIPNEDTRNSDAQDGGVGISRGRANESGQTQPTSCTLSLNNTDGKYSLRNPFSPLAGLISRNTPLRVRLTGEQFEHTPTASVRSVTSYRANSNIHTIPAPAGLQEGDVVLAFVAGAFTSVQNISPPQGGSRFIEIASIQSFDPGIVEPLFSIPFSAGIAKVFWKVAGPSEPTDYDLFLDDSVLVNIVAVQNASHAEPNVIGLAQPDLTFTVNSPSSLPGVSNLELRWAVSHADPIGTPPSWTAPEGFAQHTAAGFGDEDNSACLASRHVSTLDETGEHEFTSTVELGNSFAFTVNIYSQDTQAIRAVTEVASWPPRWVPSSINAPVELGAGDVWVPVEGGGTMRRLGQGAKPLRSAMFRIHMSREDQQFFDDSLASLHAYWPLEEGENANVGASPLMGVQDAVFTGNVETGAEAPSAGTEALVQLVDNTGFVSMTVPTFPDDWTIQRRWMIGFEFGHGDEEPVSNNLIRLQFIEQTFRWRLRADLNASGDGIDWEMLRADITADPPVNVSQDTGTSDLAPAYYVEVRKSTNVWQVFVNGVQVMNGVVPALEQIGPPISLEFTCTQSPQDREVYFGHASVWVYGNITPDDALPDILSAVDAYTGETAGRRVERLCFEEDIPFYGVGDLDETSRMGPQPIDEILSILQECEAVDLGFLYEPREQLGLVYRTRESLYAQESMLALATGAKGELIQPLNPVDDDRLVRNDVTASRPGGSSARAVLESGPLSTQRPPAGVGVYDVDDQINVESDLDLPNQAGFRLLLGTVDEARYPSIELDMLALFEFDKLDLLSRAAQLDVGDRFTLNQQPGWLPRDPVEQLALGFSETITEDTWGIVSNNAPASPFLQIADYADEEETPAPDAPGRYDTAGTRSAETFEIGVDTELLQETTAGQLWTVNNGGVLLRGTPGEAVATEDHPSLDITGDIDVRFDGTLRNWGATPDNQTLVSKYDPATSNRSWWLLITAAGQLRFQWSEDGTAILNHTADAVIPAGPSERLAVRATMDVDNGSGGRTVRFYTAATLAGPWVQLGSAQLGSPTTSIFSGSAEVRVGSFDGGGARTAGYMHAAEVRSGIDEDAGLQLDSTTPSYASTPDSAQLDVLSDIDVRVDVKLNDWASGSEQTLLSKFNPTGDQRSYLFQLSATGQLEFFWSEDGTLAEQRGVFTDLVIPPDTERIGLRFTLDADNGSGGREVQFWTAPTIAGPWTPFDFPLTTPGDATSIFNSNVELRVGLRNDDVNPAGGVVYAAEVRDGIDGTVVADPVFEEQAPSTPSFSDDAGNTWTMNGGSVIIASQTSTIVANPDFTQRGSGTFFPTVLATATTEINSASTNHSVQMPAVVETNDLLIVVCGVFADEVVGTPAGWTLLASAVPGFNQNFNVFGKIADGSEGGSTVNFTTPGASVMAAVAARIINAFPDIDEGIAVGPTDSGQGSPNSPEAVAPWGVALNTFISAAAWEDDEEVVTSFPANYSGVFTTTNVGLNSGVGAALAFRQLSIDSTDPGPFTLSGSDFWNATTIAVRPASGSSLNVTDDQGRLWTLGTGVLVNGDLPLDVRMDSIQLRVRDIHYEWPTLVDVQVEASGTTGSFSVPAPTGLQEGDLLVAFHANDVGTIQSISGGSAWTEIAQFDSLDGSGGLAVFVKVALDNEPSQYDFSQDAGADGIVALAAFRNARRIVFPTINAGYLVRPNAAGSTTLYPTIASTPIAQSFELRWVCAEVSGSFTPPGGFIEIADVNSGGFIGGALATRRIGSSPLGTGSHTFSGPVTSLTNRIVATLNIIGMQTMTVEQLPINAPAGATKLEAPGQSIALWTPARYAL